MQEGVEEGPEVPGELRHQVRKVIGPFATPDYIVLTSALPKTRSGKIMRRVLRKLAAGQADQLGDITTLADPSVVATLIEKVALVMAAPTSGAGGSRASAAAT